MILVEIDGEQTVEGILEDMDSKAEEILLSHDIDEDDVYKLANMVQFFYEKYHNVESNSI